MRVQAFFLYSILRSQYLHRQIAHLKLETILTKKNPHDLDYVQHVIFQLVGKKKFNV